MFESKIHEAKQARNMEGGGAEETIAFEKKYLSLEDYDCIGFDLDHTLCRYNVGPMIRYLTSHFSHEILTSPRPSPSPSPSQIQREREIWPLGCH